MAKAPVRFDDSLPILARVVANELGDEALSAGTVLRDSVGRLAFFSNSDLAEPAAGRLQERLREELGVYARTDRLVASPGEVGADSILADPLALQVQVGSHRVRLLDRRLVGADWLRAPAPPAPPPVRFVFASLKGGVGRSTALAVVASHLAAKSRRVLAVDLDMEAPGLGAFLLDEDTLPEFGMVDALVENGFAPLDDRFFADLVSPSPLAEKRGRIDVVPAFGRRSLQHPADVLAKISRAYAEDLQPDGTVATLLDQVRAVVEQLAAASRYDAIVVDARAGLHETTASSVLGLGAEVLLFGLDEPQTFQGYAALFAHLGRFIGPGAATPEWVERLTLVQGKAPADPGKRDEFKLRCAELMVNTGLRPRPTPPASAVPLPAGSFSKVPWDDTAPDADVLPDESAEAETLAVLDDSRFQYFDPHRRRDLLSESVYRTAYGLLIDYVERAVSASAGTSP